MTDSSGLSMSDTHGERAPDKLTIHEFVRHHPGQVGRGWYQPKVEYPHEQ
jgi:hypothetical protein